MHARRLAHGAPGWRAWRLALGVATVLVFLGLYNLVARLPLGTPIDLATPLDRAIPFLPWTWWLYVPAYAACMAFSLFAITDTRLFVLTLASLVLTQLFNDVFYVFLPAPFPRPAVVEADALTSLAFQALWRIDPPANTFPSSHVAVAVIAWRALRVERHPRAWINLGLLASILISVHTTKQHFVADSLAGLAVGWACHRLLVPGRTRIADPNAVAVAAGVAHNAGPGGPP